MTDILRVLYEWSPFDPFTNNLLLGLIAMGSDGQFGLTPLGQAFLDELDGEA
jgi:hypothetical protein